MRHYSSRGDNGFLTPCPNYPSLVLNLLQGRVEGTSGGVLTTQRFPRTLRSCLTWHPSSFWPGKTNAPYASTSVLERIRESNSNPRKGCGSKSQKGLLWQSLLLSPQRELSSPWWCPSQLPRVSINIDEKRKALIMMNVTQLNNLWRTKYWSHGSSEGTDRPHASYL